MSLMYRVLNLTLCTEKRWNYVRVLIFLAILLCTQFFDFFFSYFCMPILKSYLCPEKNPKKIRFVTYPSFFNQVMYLIFLKIFSFFRKWSNVCHYGFFGLLYQIFLRFLLFFRKWSSVCHYGFFGLLYQIFLRF